MKNSASQSKWFLLFLFLLAYILLAVVFQRMALSNSVRDIIQILLFLVITILAYAWFESSELAPISPDQKVREDPEASGETAAPAAFLTPRSFKHGVFSLLAAAIILALTILLAAGRGLLGEGVVTLIYLVPISWVTVRWGRIPGASAALSAALCFDFFFVPPFFTFRVDSLEGWLLLGIFMIIALAVVGRTVEQFSEFQRRESEHSFLADLLQQMGNLHSREEIADFFLSEILHHYGAAFVQLDLYPRDGWTYQRSLYNREVHLSGAQPEHSLQLTSQGQVIGRIVLVCAPQQFPGYQNSLVLSVCRLISLSVDRSLPAHTPGRSA